MPDPVSRKLPVLQRTGLFEGVSASTSETLLRDSRWVELSRRDILFAQGAAADAVFVIAGGRLRLLRRTPDQREITVGYRGTGEIAGESGWAAGAHEVEAQAAERALCLSIPRSRLEAALATDPRLALRLLSTVATRAVDAERRMEALLTRPVESRVATFLLEAAKRHGVPDSRGDLIGVKFTHQEIASYVGSTRETVTLILGDLKRRGVIGIDHRRVIVLDPGKLAALV